ncbi:MAG TPA: beta tubulin [Rhodospirillaceae bacterium]|nr:beta tubulin [Rhodospirillaceae bacterium]
MKELSTALAAHLNGELTTLCELVKITRRDGAVVAFTNHDRDLVVDGVCYKADGAFSAGAMTQQLDMKTRDYDVVGLLDSAMIDGGEIEAGLYDHARIDVTMCNWADVSQGVLQVRRGWLGEIAMRGGQYTASLRGLHDLLSRRVGQTYTPECRYDCGDGRCGVNLAALMVSGSVTSVIDGRGFVDAARGEESGYFQDAKLTWVTGANAGASVEVSGWDNATQIFTLWLPMGRPIEVGDQYQVAAGCDKRFATCRARFNNAVNYGGFPHLPGIGRVMGYPS